MTRERRQRLKIVCLAVLPAAVLAVDGWFYVSMEAWTYSLLHDGAAIFWPSVVSFGLVFFPFAALAFGYDLFRYLSTRERARWPTVEGRVTAATIETIDVARGKGLIPTDVEFHPMVTYGYEVAGVTHGGEIPAIRYERREAAENVLRFYPVGATLRVYYDPEDASASVVETS